MQTSIRQFKTFQGLKCKKYYNKNSQPISAIPNKNPFFSFFRVTELPIARHGGSHHRQAPPLLLLLLLRPQ